MNLQPVVSATPFAHIRRTLRRSSLLRKVYNELQTDDDLLKTRHIPEGAFSESIKCELMKLKEIIGKNKLGNYFEFGVFNGTSLSCTYQVLNELNLTDIRCFGFDSFEGLPEEAAHDDNGVWIPGQFACRIDVTKKLLDERNIDWERVALIKGWFDSTLNASTIEQHKIGSVSVAMIDCDLYSSTSCCLEFIAPLLTDNAVLIFDDWYSHGLAEKRLGERKAFEEFINKHHEFTAEEAEGYNEFSKIIRLSRSAVPD